MTPRLLLDENVSPSIAPVLRARGFDVYHVRDRALSGAADHVLWHRAFDEDRILVTINVRDFVRLATRSELHAGLITFPSGCTAYQQLTLISGALEFLGLEERGHDAVNRWLEISEDGAIKVHDLPT